VNIYIYIYIYIYMVDFALFGYFATNEYIGVY